MVDIDLKNANVRDSRIKNELYIYMFLFHA